MNRGSSRVAVTGVGIVSALGPGREATFARLLAGEVGIGSLSLFDFDEPARRLAAQVSSVEALRAERDGAAWSRSDLLAASAAREAIEHAAFGSLPPLFVAVGGTTGGMLEAERPLAASSGAIADGCIEWMLAYPLSTSALRLEADLGTIERSVTVCSACSSGANAIVLGASWIRAGRTNVALAGGTDALCRLTYVGFNALGLLDREPCRPFDRARAGLTIGEGAAFLVLESEAYARGRGARVLGWLSGHAVAAEAYHITHPEPSAATSVALLRSALRRAGLEPSGVDYVNAHGTGTRQNDSSEARALREVFGTEISRVPVSSSKGQVGHTLGAAGAMEAAFTLLACERGVILPSGGLVDPDPELGLRHVLGSAERRLVRAAVSSSFGFGGAGTVLVFEREDAPLRSEGCRETSAVISAALVQGALGDRCGAASVEYLEGTPVASLELPPLLERLDAARSRRFDRASALVTLGARTVLAEAGLEAAGTGLVAGSAFGNVERSVEFLRRAFERGPRFASPAEFPHLVPSAAAGNASIYLGLTGPVLTVCDVEAAAETALEVGVSLIEAELACAVVVGGAEQRDAVVEQVLGPLHGGTSDSPRGEAGAWLVVESADAAASRGRRPLARLIATRVISSADDLRAPEVPARAVVVSAGPLAASDAPLGGWVSVARREVAGDGIPREALGGIALGCAVGLIARGDYDVALVLARAATGWRATWLEAPTA